MLGCSRFHAPKAIDPILMPFFSLFRLDLRWLILALAMLSAVAALINTFYASYYVQRDVLIENTLEANRVYASKLASSIESFFRSVRQQLAYSADLLASHMDEPMVLQAEVKRLALQTDSFNSVLVADNTGVIQALYPEGLSLVGHRLETLGAQMALNDRRPLITKPYVAASNNLIVGISQPIFGADTRYLGYLHGTIYLQHKNVLNRLLSDQYYRDGSYLYVVDQDGRLIHHMNPTWVGELIKGNLAIDAVIHGKSGSMQLINSRGVDMLAGYAPIPSAGWGVIAQRPTKATLAELDGLMWAILRHVLPWAILGTICIYLLARLISQPLWQLAKGVRQMGADDAVEQIQNVRSWYFEATQLKRALLSGLNSLHRRIGSLNRDILTDPLSGLYNRRGLTVTLDAWQGNGQVFAIVALDIDHFKRVNDTYGHDMGDQVIKYLAQMMRESSRAADVLCRHGGEEFLMLLPGACLDDARQVAERLRLRMQLATIPGIDSVVTISLGVAQWRPMTGCSIEQALKMADQALYAAKQQGRNQVVVARRRSSAQTEVQCE